MKGGMAVEMSTGASPVSGWTVASKLRAAGDPFVNERARKGERRPKPGSVRGQAAQTGQPRRVLRRAPPITPSPPRPRAIPARPLSAPEAGPVRARVPGPTSAAAPSAGAAEVAGAAAAVREDPAATAPGCAAR